MQLDKLILSVTMCVTQTLKLVTEEASLSLVTEVSKSATVSSVSKN